MANVSRQALRRIRRGQHDTTPSAKLLRQADDAALADRIGFVFHLSIGVANTVCLFSILRLALGAVSDFDSLDPWPLAYHTAVIIWFLQVMYARSSQIRETMPSLGVTSRMWGENFIGQKNVEKHRSFFALILHTFWLVARTVSRSMVPLAMALVGPIVEPLMDWFLDVDAYLFCASNPNRSLDYPVLTKALEEYELEQSAAAQNALNDARDYTVGERSNNDSESSPPVRTSSMRQRGAALSRRSVSSRKRAPPEPPLRLTKAAFEIFSEVVRRTSFAGNFVECTFLAGSNRLSITRDLISLALVLIPVGLRCLYSDGVSVWDCMCVGSGVAYICLVMFAHSWHHDPAMQAAVYLSGIADGFSVFVMSTVAFAPQLADSEWPATVRWTLWGAFAGVVCLLTIHVWIVGTNTDWRSATRTRTPPGRFRTLRMILSVVFVRIPTIVARFIFLVLFVTLSMCMDRMCAFWSVDTALHWYLGDSRYVRLIVSTIAVVPSSTREKLIAGALDASSLEGRRYGNTHPPAWPVIQFTGFDRRLLWVYVACQVPAAVFPFVLVATTSAASVPTLLWVCAWIAVVTTVCAGAGIVSGVRRYWRYRGWLVPPQFVNSRFRSMIRWVMGLHRPTVGMLLKHRAISNDVVPADVLDDLVGPFLPTDRLTDRLSLSECGELGYGLRGW